MFLSQKQRRAVKSWKLNTSNLGKFEEFKYLFAKHGIDLEASHFDLKEIDSDPIKVVAHKASQLEENIIVDDTSLDIEGTTIGINIRWLLEHLTQCVGRIAKWTVLLAYRQGNQIYIYKGMVSGSIVLQRGTAGFGFDPVFLPDGSQNTLAQVKPDMFNARALAVESLIKGDVWIKHPLIEHWEGPWQKNSH